MLRLAKLELNGFKSFATPTTLLFDGGISAVVGPNGCGKSNICDAVTWVLGEQSAKTLRGEKMEDVIFNGASKRHPLGLAEVFLTLTDDTGAFSETGGAVTIGRRVYRSGEGEYYLNGRRVRLKDVQDLLFDTGLGIRAYSIIEQAKIGMILSSKPQDRRKLIEEAAGISKYKAKKKAAELKLEEAGLNLARVEDIVGEVAQRMNSLKRQAARAKRYQEVDVELGGLKRRLYRSRFFDLNERLGTQHAALVTAKDEEAQSLAAASRHKLDLDGARNSVEAVFAQLAARREEAMGLKGQVERGEEALKSLSRSAIEAQERRRLLSEMRERLVAERDGLAGGIAEREAAATERERAIADRRLELANAETAYREAADDERRANAAREELRERLLVTIAKLAENRNLAHQATLGVEKIDYALTKIAQDFERNEAKSTETGAGLVQLAAEEQATAEKLAAARARVEALEDDRRRIESDLAGTRREIDGVRHDLIATRLERDSLLESERAQRTAAGGAELALAAQGETDRAVGSDYLEARGNYEAVLDFYLRELLHGVVVDGPGTAARLLAEVKAQDGGRTTFVSREWGGVLGGGHRPSDPRILTSVREAISVSPGAREWMLAAIPDAYVVDSIAAATELAARYPDTPFLTLDLDLVVNNRVSGGAAPPRGIFTLRRDLKAANERLLELATRETALAARLAGLEEEHETCLRDLALEVERRGAEQHAAALHQARRQALESEALRLGRERDVLNGEREMESEERVRLSGRRSELELLLAELSASEASLGEEVTASGIRQQQIHERTQELQRAAAALATVTEVEQEKLTAAVAELENARRNLISLERRLEERQREDAELVERLERVGVEEAHEREALTRALGEYDRRRDEIAVLEDHHARAREALVPAERLVAHTEEALAAIRDRVLTLEVDVARLESDLKHLRAAYVADLHEAFPGEAPEQPAGAETDAFAFVDAASLAMAMASGMGTEIPAEDAQPAVAAELDPEALALAMASGMGHELPPDAVAVAPVRTAWPEEPETLPLAELEQIVAQLSRRLESLGPVNLLAIDEFREHEQRHEFLTTQRTDLLQSIDALRETIRKINRTSTELFTTAFAAINANFDVAFRQLFRGGAASMRLIDEADPLDSGIEIMAQPPGKRSQNILLLSGGEKALTAIAFLFAIFRYKPSPFCILDEVDAPLDENNVERFTGMLREMTHETQFVLITHNRRTMETADVLYGVTMEEAGVSKLVSVRWNEAPKLAAAGR